MRFFDEVAAQGKHNEVYELHDTLPSWVGVRIRVHREKDGGRGFSLLFNDKEHLPKMDTKDPRTTQANKERLKVGAAVPLVLALTRAKFKYIGTVEGKKQDGRH